MFLKALHRFEDPIDYSLNIGCFSIFLQEDSQSEYD